MIQAKFKCVSILSVHHDGDAEWFRARFKTEHEPESADAVHRATPTDHIDVTLVDTAAAKLRCGGRYVISIDDDPTPEPKASRSRPARAGSSRRSRRQPA